MAEYLDVRGLSCPQPVFETKKVMDSLGSGTIRVRVDSATARDNITRLAEKKGWKIELLQTADEYELTLTRE